MPTVLPFADTDSAALNANVAIPVDRSGRMGLALCHSPVEHA